MIVLRILCACLGTAGFSAIAAGMVIRVTTERKKTARIGSILFYAGSISFVIALAAKFTIF